MNETSYNAEPDGTCANCGTPLSAQFCPECGQSRDALQRPIYDLAKDTLDGLFDWDGRFLTTLRQLYTRPGRVARDYADGCRARFTPPVRLYVLVSLVFFSVMALSGVRLIGLDVGQGSDNSAYVNAAPFQTGAPPEPVEFTAEQQAQYEEAMRDGGLDTLMPRMLGRALSEPADVEASVNAAASQVLILMVAILALLNMALHPRQPIINHVIYALYGHAALLPFLALSVIVTAYAPLPTLGSIAWLVIVLLAAFWGVWAFDRGFYKSSWWGAALRTAIIAPVYSVLALLAALGMIILVSA